MFTGLIEEIGKIVRVDRMGQGMRLVVTAPGISMDGDIALGDSIAINGVCLTVVKRAGSELTFDVVPETVIHSTLSALHPGSQVNVERAMRSDTRLGGHIVAGHVDGVGEITQIRQDHNAKIYTVKIATGLLRYIVAKGSVAIDGISLTVMDTDHSQMRVSVVPHSIQHTVLKSASVGTKVNIEVDAIGKYVEKLHVESKPLAASASSITLKKLREWGY